MLVIGHRGARGHAPENTVASVVRAIELGARHVEVDVHVVEDRLVVIHDDRLERTTDGAGRVADQTFASIRRLDAGGGERVPTLTEVWEAARGRAALNVELKGPRTAEPFVAWATACGARPEDVLVSAFDAGQLRLVRVAGIGLRLGTLFASHAPGRIEEAVALDAYSVHPAWTNVSAEWVDAAHAAGLKVFAYTVNETADMRRAAALGVDGIFTDYPDRARDALAPAAEVPPRWP